jgi:hypothetical protein
MVVFVILNLRITNYIIWVLASIIIGLSSYILLNSYYIKSKRYIKIIELSVLYQKQRKITYAIIAVFTVIFSAFLLIFGGILMSYLFSQNQ